MAKTTKTKAAAVATIQDGPTKDQPAQVRVLRKSYDVYRDGKAWFFRCGSSGWVAAGADMAKLIAAQVAAQQLPPVQPPADDGETQIDVAEIVPRLEDIYARTKDKATAKLLENLHDNEVTLAGKTLDQALQFIAENPWEPPVEEAAAEVGIVLTSIDACEIDPSPFQPRQEFPAAEIEALAVSLRQQGQTTPAIVRPMPGGRYQLVAGERRWRAVQLNRSHHQGNGLLRCEVVPLSDAQVRETLLAEVFQRADLSPIDQAIAFRQSIDAGDYAGPTELARAHGLSQPYVSHHLQLLEMPPDWQSLIAAGAITERHCRELRKYVFFPEIMDEIRRQVLELARNVDGWTSISAVMSSAQLAALAAGVARAKSRPMPRDGKVFHNYGQRPLMRDVPMFEPRGDEATRLQLFELEDELRAANEELWEELLEAHCQRLAIEGGLDDADAEPTEDDPEGDEDAGPQELDIEADPCTVAADVPVELRRKVNHGEVAPPRTVAADEEFSLSAGLFAAKLYRWKMNWLRSVIADELISHAEPNDLLPIALLALDVWGVMVSADADRGGLAAAVTGFLGRGKLKAQPVKALFGSMNDADRAKAAAIRLAGLFYDDETGPSNEVPDADVEELAKQLKISLADEWKNDAAGQFTRGYWEMHSKAQLLAIAQETGRWGKEWASWSKAKIVDSLLENNGHDPAPMPKEIAAVKRPKD